MGEIDLLTIAILPEEGREHHLETGLPIGVLEDAETGELSSILPFSSIDNAIDSLRVLLTELEALRTYEEDR